MKSLNGNQLAMIRVLVVIEYDYAQQMAWNGIPDGWKYWENRSSEWKAILEAIDDGNRK